MYDALKGGYSKKDFSNFISANKVAILSSQGGQWGVQATTVFYTVEENFNILVKMHTESSKGKLIKINPNVALAIYNPASTYSQKEGVSLLGVVERITNREEMIKAVEIYSKAFEGEDKRFASIEGLISLNVKSTLFRIRLISGKMITPEGYSEDFQILQ